MPIADIVNGESVASVTSKLNAAFAVVNDAVVGPDTSTDNAVAIYDATGGHTLLDSALVVNDTTGATALTSAAAAALAVGPNGATNPALVVDASTASSATGIKVKSAAAAAGVAVSVVSSGTNENLTVDAKGSGTLTLQGTATGAITLARDVSASGHITLADAKNIVLDTTTGTQIGTAASQKLGFFGATPVVQQTELTDELTTITFTAPVTPDYALQDLVDTGGFGFKTKDEGNSVLAVVANLQTRTKELEDKLKALGLIADAD
jgi:hypothetical protein